jgi:TPR repeat protein
MEPPKPAICVLVDTQGGQVGVVLGIAPGGRDVAVTRDPAKALATLRGLCDEGFDDGCVGWAIVLASGSRTDVAKAKQFLEAVCDRGSEEACALLKSMPR